MISQKFVRLIADNAKEITNYWVKDISENITTPSYKEHDKDECFAYGMSILKELGDWIDNKKRATEIKEIYLKIGKERAKQNIPLEEVVSANLILKRHIWLYVLSRGFLSNAFELYQVLEINNQVVYFFDRLVFYLVYGYELETTAKIKGMEHLFGRD